MNEHDQNKETNIKEKKITADLMKAILYSEMNSTQLLFRWQNIFPPLNLCLWHQEILTLNGEVVQSLFCHPNKHSISKLGNVFLGPIAGSLLSFFPHLFSYMNEHGKNKETETGEKLFYSKINPTQLSFSW